MTQAHVVVMEMSHVILTGGNDAVNVHQVTLQSVTTEATKLQTLTGAVNKAPQRTLLDELQNDGSLRGCMV